MSRKALVATVLLVLMGLSSIYAQQRGRGRGPSGPPDIEGKWTGTWSYLNPAQATAQPKELCKKLDADVVKNGDKWTATFEGDCGRPYKYKVALDGRSVANVVMFQGTVDLGAQDGGVFDWIGRATGSEFIGFYTSAAATGTFSLTRVK
jgi:hypothetical protein